jgi:hypothetical protein
MAPEPAPRKGGEWRPVITLDRRAFVAILLGVCILSSAVGAGLGLIAETGPAGTPGERGPVGPEGPQGQRGPSGAAEIEGLEAEVEELRGEIVDSEGVESRLDDLESALEGLESFSPDLCDEFEALC